MTDQNNSGAVAAVVWSSVGPTLLVYGVEVRFWLGTCNNDGADQIAANINAAALAKAEPVAFMEWRNELAQKVDEYIQGEADGEGAGDEAYKALKAHILATPFTVITVQPVPSLTAVTHALTWLKTLVNSPDVKWKPEQKQAALDAYLAAKGACEDILAGEVSNQG